ncbi:DUF1294 domain-containing protein [Clostridium isatidis]|uniref:DUF1294 domain-containing protein n=1 Tax=Clostridium isatidis TaxID=182773 RepID=A0A343JAK7_9CLOT|nr:DUF1294 domain-containing protein [Clostridium isatidis]ASW42565.1 hypothetical protein BEN51_03450 [Clostridium isatidis]NLZ34969.1 DUF1294 domain-containing protein [Clostridiales bacterium]
MKDIFLIYIILINLISYNAMFIDKRRSISGKWRIKETTLLFLAAIGGSIGEYIGMYTFRHKTKHYKFSIGLPLIIFAQILLIKKLI